MNKYLFLVAFCSLASSAALAQTVSPRNTVPGAQPVVTPDMRNAGSPYAPHRDEKIPGISHQSRKQLRKMSRTNATPDGTRKRRHN